jgi:hypothetical protein
MSTISDFKDLLRAFNEYQVKYLVVGGYAVMKYAEPRYTKDLDIWVSTEEANAAAVYKALKSFGAPLLGMTPHDFTLEGYFYQIGVAPVRIDILMALSGVTFEDAWAKRVESDLDGVKTFFISKGDLITSKKAVGRPQDLIDAELLTASDRTAKGPKPR